MARPSFKTAVTSLGLVSPIGRDVVTAAAARRAGIIRREPIEGLSVVGEEDLEEPVVGAAISGLTDGYMQAGAWLRMAAAALDDLVAFGGLPGPADVGFWRDTALVWLLPAITPDRFLWPPDQIPELLQAGLGEALGDITRLPFRRPVTFLPAGAVGLAAAVEQFSRGTALGARAVVMATDSWLDSMAIGWLMGQRRLKTAANPVGLCPGEAAACVLLEDAREARARSGTLAASVLASASRAAARGTSDDDEPLIDGAPAQGIALAQAIEAALRAAMVPLPFRGDIYLDLNGESWKATAWGTAQPPLLSLIDFPACQVHFPAVEMGDVGAASSVTHVCLSVRGLQRGYAAGSLALIGSIGDDGQVGAVVIGAA